MSDEEGTSKHGKSNANSAHLASKTSKKGSAASFTQKTPEYKFLKKTSEAGDIVPSDKPSEVYYQHGSFSKYTTNQFRSQFNKLKTAIGLHTRAAKR
jgi:hypothetical protein